MIKELLYILMVLILTTSCNSGGQSKDGASVDTLSKKDSKPPDTTSNQSEVIEINCDSIYNDKGYRLKLVSLENNSGTEASYNFVFIAVKLINGKETEIHRDTIESTTQKIKFSDFNNDNIKDILIQNISDVRSNWTYYLYLVDIKKDKFQKIKGFEEIKNPNYIPKYDLIDNMVMSGKDWTNFYKIKADSIKDFDIVIYDNHTGNASYERDYNRAIKTILKREKNNR